jgi:glyoxylate reductase
MALMGLGCPGKTVGMVGLGAVALHMVQRLRALEIRVLYAKRHRLSPGEEAALGVEYATFEEVLQQGDFVCVEVSYNPTTHQMFGDREFSLMKPTAYFINTARGRIVDEDALVRALQSKTIAGAALDVFYHEPPAVWDPEVPLTLREMDNVILAPHNGGATFDSRNRQVLPLAEGVRDLIEGRRPAGLLNPEVYGDPVLYPEFYNRGPVEAGDNGPTHFPVTA